MKHFYTFITDMHFPQKGTYFRNILFNGTEYANVLFRGRFYVKVKQTAGQWVVQSARFKALVLGCTLNAERSGAW